VLSVLAVALAGLVLAAGAMAYWSATGRGHGLAATASMPQVTGVAARQDMSLEVTWAPVDLPAGAVTYTVKRIESGTQVVCTTSATACTLPVETNPLAKYSVSAQLNAWSGPDSERVRP